MPIEFRCSGCNKLLRVKDESGGKKAKCPDCGTIIQIPMPESAAGDDYEVEAPAINTGPPAGSQAGASASASQNPFQSPEASSAAPSGPVGTGEIQPTRIEMSQVLNDAWAICKNNFGLLIGAMFVVGFINTVVTYGMMFVAFFAIAQLELVGFIFVIFGILVALTVQLYMMAGQILLTLNIARGREASIGDLFSGGKYVMPLLGGMLLVQIAVQFGMMFFIVPGVILALMWSQFQFLIVDRNMSVMDALSKSNEITNGNKLTLFLLGIVAAGIVFLGMLACGVGVIVSMAYINVIMPVAYLRMSGQPVANA